MILPKNAASVVVSLALVALLLSAILWYLPTYPETDFWGKFLNNWVSLVAFFVAAYWATTIKRRTPL